MEKKPIDTVDDIYCGHVYKNIYIEKFSDSTVKLSSCCVNRTSEPTGYVNFATDPYLVSQREGIRQGIKVSGCDMCWQQEAQGAFSLRRRRNNSLGADNPYRVELLGMHYNVAPICNAKCIICSSYFSSAWAAEDAKFDKSIPARNFAETKQTVFRYDLDLSQLKEIYFNGGEPLLSDDMPDMLEKIRQAQGNLKGVHISFNTNGSLLPSARLQALCADGKAMVINMSVDGIGAAFDYIRYPLQWNEVERNIVTLASTNLLRHSQSYKVELACVVGVHNVLEVQNLADWVECHRPDLPWLGNLVVHPCYGWLGFDQVSTALAAEIDRRLPHNELGARIRPWLQSACQDSDSQWISWLESMDRRRGLDWQHALPNLAQAMQTVCKKTQ